VTKPIQAAKVSDIEKISEERIKKDKNIRLEDKRQRELKRLRNKRDS